MHILKMIALLTAAALGHQGEDSSQIRVTVWNPPRAHGRLPTLIFSPGYGQTPSNYATLLADWARHGYVVIAIAHPRFLNPDSVELHDASRVIARQIVDATNRIIRESARPGSLFYHVDPQRLGVVGHSIGGSAAAQACAWDARLRAGMDLDGTIFGDVVHSGMSQPFFLVYRRQLPLPWVDELYGGPIQLSWHKLKVWIEERRRVENRQSFYEWFQWTAERLGEYEKGGERTPAYIAHKNWKWDDD